MLKGGGSFTLDFVCNKIFPSLEIQGSTPCSKNTTLFLSSPKYLCLSKNDSVGPLVGPLVMIYHGTITFTFPALLAASS